jgi:phosphohistidine phosphatase
VDALLARLQALAADVNTVLLIGHNEGIAELAETLAGHGAPAALASLRAKFPTGALATLQASDAPWHDLAPGRAELLAFVRPGDLMPE